MEIEEMAYPMNFNFEEFASLSSYAQRVRYCEERLQRIGQGSARIVYRVDNEKVLKLAKNQKGIAQNQEEANSYAIEVGIGAEVFEFSDNGEWIEMEVAQKAKKSDFNRILGVNFDFFCDIVTVICSYYRRANGYGGNWTKYNKQDIEDFLNRCSELEEKGSDFFNCLYDYMANTGLEAIGDLKRISSWGIVKRNGTEELVLIDMGLTDDTMDLYRSKSLRESELKYIIKEVIKEIRPKK